MRRLLTVLTLAGLTGCALAEPRVCTAIGTPVGVGVTVEPPLAARVASAAVEVCWDGSCHRPPLELHPVTRPGGQTCAGESCAVTMRPTGGATGFAQVAGLPKRPVRVRLTLRDSRGQELADTTVEVTPAGRFPNGPGCGEGGPNTAVMVDRHGTARPRD
ncbi:hypothetical protein ACGF0J_04810 [Nonomuraea sp. NPDC047897]|uniref:hypothetical protein n=1 Tax=Nonomuraea sp. NPDC047897 TaxID=3364346 RepID=UPI00372474BF